MIKAHTLRSANLNWLKGDRRFHADASTLCFIPGLPMPRHLEVVSTRTGASAFYEIHEAITSGGDIVGWNYLPADGCGNARTTRGVVIWNT